MISFSHTDSTGKLALLTTGGSLHAYRAKVACCGKRYRPAHKGQIWIACVVIRHDPASARNGGSARAYEILG